MENEESPAPVKQGDVIAEKYCVDRVLGAGGMGVVVLATDTTLETPRPLLRPPVAPWSGPELPGCCSDGVCGYLDEQFVAMGCMDASVFGDTGDGC